MSYTLAGRFAWLFDGLCKVIGADAHKRRVLPETAQFAGVLSYLLDDPETAALVQKAPEAGRILRPLCHILGVKQPAFLTRRNGAVESPPPHLASPPPRAERNEDDGDDALEVEAAVAAEVPQVLPQLPLLPAAAAIQRAPLPPRPGGLIWDGNRWQWG